MFRYFASVGGAGDTESQVERRVMASSPIMEAIGEDIVECDVNYNFN